MAADGDDGAGASESDNDSSPNDKSAAEHEVNRLRHELTLARVALADPSSRLRDLTFERQIGRGAFGEVAAVRATHARGKLGPLLALKVGSHTSHVNSLHFHDRTFLRHSTESLEYRKRQVGLRARAVTGVAACGGEGSDGAAAASRRVA